MLQQLGITKITIDLPFRLNHVNSFVGESEAGYVILDTGLHNEVTINVWEAVLKEIELKQIIVSHLHPDHSGYAGELQRKTGATVAMPKIDYDAMKRIWQENPRPFVQEDYDKSAVPGELAKHILDNIDGFRLLVSPFPEVTHFLEEKDVIQIGTETYEVIATPGHSPGLVTFYNREKSVLLSTDHLLPKITPNISYWFYGEKNPLQSYAHSLNKIKQLDVEYVVPSHGEPFYNANKRIDEIWKHHEERLALALETMKNGATVFAVCEALFQGELTIHEYQFAIGEAFAHVEYLREKGECSREVVDGKWMYRRS